MTTRSLHSAYNSIQSVVEKFSLLNKGVVEKFPYGVRSQAFYDVVRNFHVKFNAGRWFPHANGSVYYQ